MSETETKLKRIKGKHYTQADHKQAVKLRKEGRTYLDISKIMGIPEGSVRAVLTGKISTRKGKARGPYAKSLGASEVSTTIPRPVFSVTFRDWHSAAKGLEALRSLTTQIKGAL